MVTIETVKEAVRRQETTTIIDAVRLIGGGDVDQNLRIARAAAIDVLAERKGDAFADYIMDLIGL